MYIYWKPWYISILDMHIYNNAYGGNGGGGKGGGYVFERYMWFTAYKKTAKDHFIDKYLD